MVRKEVEDFLIKMFNDLAVKGKEVNEKIYRELFASMNDKEFDLFMIGLRDKEHNLSMYAPNGGAVVCTTANSMKVGASMGMKFHQKVYKGKDGPLPGGYMPYEVMVMLMPGRRTKQTAGKGITVPKDNKSIDYTSGQVTGASKGSKLTAPEAGLLDSMGFHESLIEVAKDRGGDLGAMQAFYTTLYKTGEVEQSTVDQNSTGVVSMRTLDTTLKAMHLQPNIKK